MEVPLQPRSIEGFSCIEICKAAAFIKFLSSDRILGLVFMEKQSFLESIELDGSDICNWALRHYTNVVVLFGASGKPS